MIRTDFTMTIDGKAVSGRRAMDVVNPATGQSVAQAPNAVHDDLDAAVAAARAAYAAWRHTTIDERKRLLLLAADVIAANADDLGLLFTREQGRPVSAATQEILAAADWIRAIAAMDLPVEHVAGPMGGKVEIHHEPIGVVGAIVPWNFPVLLAAWKIAPALLAGNTMVLKPSPFTPLCMLRIGELLRGVLPDGVLNVVSGGDELGPWMTGHPGIDKVSFTGSTRTGRRVMASAAETLKRVTLELGGNDAAIVLADVDVDQIAEQIFFGTSPVLVSTISFAS